VTVFFLPFYVPLAMAHPSLRGLSYAPSSIFAIGLPLLSTLVVPIVVGLVVKALAPGWAARLVPIGGKLATIALLVVVLSTFGANFQDLIRIVRGGAVPAAVLLIAEPLPWDFCPAVLNAAPCSGSEQHSEMLPGPW
jgi:predicted Na+-dependent transporter